MIKTSEIVQKLKDASGDVQMVLNFGTYELSIVRNAISYGNKKGLFEIGVFKGEDMVSLPGITEDHDTVKGFLSPESVGGIIKKMYFISGKTPV